MADVLYLAWRYLLYHKLKTAVLILSVTVIIYLPVGLDIVVTQSAEHLTARAHATPLLVGAKGSPLELALNSLYFESEAPEPTLYTEAERINDSGLAKAIPLYNRFRSQKIPIVGTTLDYFDFRGLTLERGRPMGMLGECVLGARAAESAPDGYIISSPESVFDLAGVYPLKMKVTGVLAPTGGPDDGAAFVDIKTAWVIEGLAHGHQDMKKPEAAAGVLKKEEGNIVANASVVQYNEITADNVYAFHFHGDPSGFPITSVIVVPENEKSSTLLQGRYLGEDERVQIVNPSDVIQGLLDTILTVQTYVTAAVAVVGLSTLATMSLVFLLSLQLRRREIETMVKIGGARLRVNAVLAAEILGVLAFGALLALLLSALTAHFGAAVMRMFVLSS